MQTQAESILQMAKGAIMEQVDIEVTKIVSNILDVNTAPKKKRQLALTVDFLPSEDRSKVTISATAKSKLQPNNAIETQLYVDIDHNTGEIQAVEMVPNIPGQTSLFGGEQEEPKALRFVGGK